METTSTETIGGFRRLAVIGAGAQGRVWRAVCVSADQGIVPVGTEVALKIHYEQGDKAEAQWQKLESRVAELKGLDHPNVVRYLGCFREKDIDQEKHVVVQELLNGQTLRERIDAINKWNPGKYKLGLDVDEGIRIVRQAAEGLGYVASKGPCHRDVKPANIFLCEDGTVKLIDFGVAKQSDGTISEEGNIHGSWNYLSPDFTDPEFHGDQQSDIFSLGVVLHEILTGRLPYLLQEGDDMAAYYARWSQASGSDKTSPIRIVSNTRRLLLGLDTIFDCTLTPIRAERYREFSQFVRALDDIRFVEHRHGDRTYRRVQFVGEGGFGVVFKARWLEKNESVAIKILKDKAGAVRFRSEASVMQKMDGPCFTKFIDFFETDDQSFLVMEFLADMPGSSLRDAINRSRIEARMNGDENGTGGLPKRLVLPAFERYARGLALLHRHNPPIIHRDIKPANLYCPANHPERVAIMDFGIVREGEGQSTVSGVVPCTFDYAPPEIAVTLDRGSPGMDIFALGLCLYEALTGRYAYPRLAAGRTGMLQYFERCKRQQQPVFDDPRVTGDPDLLDLLRRMTDPDVSKRLSDANGLAAELRNLFYREIDGDEAETAVFDAQTDRTVAISGDKLAEWYGVWNKGRVLNEEQLMELYREQWRKEHEDEISEKVRRLARRSHWRSVLAAVAFGILTGAGLLFAWPHFETYMRTRYGSQNAQLKIERMNFRTKYNELVLFEPVQTRRERLSKAENLLNAAVSEEVDVTRGILYEETDPAVRDLRTRISDLRQKSIGLVENRCGDKILVDGQPVYDGQTERIIVEDGKPATRQVSRFGYAPKNLPADFDGKILILTTNDFTALPVSVALPEDMDKDVLCLFDGRRVTGAFKVTPREAPYRCVFRRFGHEEKTLSFVAEVGKGVRLERLGRWSVRPVEVTVASVGSGVTVEVDGSPVAGKVSLLPGRHALVYRRRGYDDLEGTFEVRVGTPCQAPRPDEIGSWKMSTVRVGVPVLEAGVVCFFDGREERRGACEVLPGRHTYRYERAGYVPQKERDFLVAVATPTNLPSPVRWVAEKVRVTLPEGEKDMTIRLEGRTVSGTILLEPGRQYVFEYEQRIAGGRRTQKMPLFVSVNMPTKLSPPTETDWNVVLDQPQAKKSKPRPPTSAAQKEYAEAMEYFDFRQYDEAFGHFYNAFKKGYALSEADMAKVEKSFSEAHEVLLGHIDEWKRRKKHQDSHRNVESYQQQINDFIRKRREMKGDRE